MFETILISVGCLDPGEVLNAQRIDDVFRTTTVVVYTCNPGYRLDGASALTCQSTGQWSEQAPRCVDLSGTCLQILLQ